MKINHLRIERFKRFDHYDLSFQDKVLGESSDRFLILGDNGSGKTTILQAIALPLAIATRQISEITEFDWIGFQANRYARQGHPRIELTVEFTKAEIEKTIELALRWKESRAADYWLNRVFVPPGDQLQIKLILDGFKLLNPVHELAQFWGRYYVLRLMQSQNERMARSEFSKIPRVFWFDQFRNLASPPVEQENIEDGADVGRVNYSVGVDRLRKHLLNWDYRRRVNGLDKQQDYLQQLDTLYRRVFPRRSLFGGIEPMHNSPDSQDYFFLLKDEDNHTYDITEMSAGEQNVFPILYEFTRQQIGYSVILIDEVDLNLHPPAAQALATQLPKIDPTSQFIMTTHSEAVSDVIREEVTHRLPGGALCL